MSHYNILVIDDDELTRKMFAERIDQENEFTVVEAKDGQEGWELLKSQEYDLVMTGIEMPRMGGFELIHTLNEDPEFTDIPVFILSHLGREQDKEKARQLGVENFIIRGYMTPNDVILQMRKTLIGKRQYYELRIAPDSPDYQVFVKDFFGSACGSCLQADQLPIKLICKTKNGEDFFMFEKDCDRC